MNSVNKKLSRLEFFQIMTLAQFKMPKKQRNRDKNKYKIYQPDQEKVVTQTTLDISKEILDQIEMDEHCKVCYIDDQHL